MLETQTAQPSGEQNVWEDLSEGLQELEAPRPPEVSAPVAVPVVEMPTADVAEVPAPTLDVTEPVMPVAVTTEAPERLSRNQRRRRAKEAGRQMKEAPRPPEVAAPGYEPPRMETTAEPGEDIEASLPEWMRTPVVEKPIEAAPVVAEAPAPVGLDVSSGEPGIAPEAVDAGIQAITREQERIAAEAGNFAEGIARAKGIAEAADDAVGVLRRDLGEREISAKTYTKSEWKPMKEEKDDETIARMQKALSEISSLFELDIEGVGRGLYEMGRQLNDQEYYQEMRKYAEELTARDLPGLKKALKELAPGMFGRGAVLQKEMGGLGEFFVELGGSAEVESLRKQLAKIENARTEGDLFWDLMDKKQRDTVAMRENEIRLRLSALESLDGLLAMRNVPAELRDVIEAVRKGENYDFGEGPIGEFRKKIYADILGSLGLELGTRQKLEGSQLGGQAGVSVVAEPVVEQVAQVEMKEPVETEQMRFEKLVSDFEKAHGTMSAEQAARDEDQTEKRVDRYQGGGVPAEGAGARFGTLIEKGQTDEEKKRRRDAIAHGVLEMTKRVKDAEMESGEKRKKLEYLGLVAEGALGAGSAGFSLIDFIIQTVIQETEVK